ncbi:demethylrebeccamycin-D-glucose O-methyltransferase [bacterium MnTg04]|nr:demethylrebeccamycin-D-glucose O-methyltransferase [bacterium MnTg04]
MDNHVKSRSAKFYEMPVLTLLFGSDEHPGGIPLTRELAGSALVGCDDRVLDVACGRGESARVLTEHFGCRIVGIDYSEENIRRANELTENVGLSSRVKFVQGDAERLPFANDSFDVVICECSLSTFPDLALALTEMKRVLRPGGRLGISDVVLNQALPESLQDLVGHVLCISGALPIDGYRDVLDQTGFSAIRTRDVSEVLGDMISRMERRIGVIENFLDREQFELANGLSASFSSISAARDFVLSGGAGYALITGKKPIAN